MCSAVNLTMIQHAHKKAALNRWLFTMIWVHMHFEWIHDITYLNLSKDLDLPLQWRHNERDGISNHKRLDCLLKSLFRCRSRKTSKLPVTGLCEGNSLVTGEFPAQRASNVENVPIWWRHHAHCWQLMPCGIMDLRSTWDQVMACYLMSPSHYLNQCGPIISKVLHHSTKPW